MESYLCELCKRKVSYITYHHLVPREEGGRFSLKVALCQPCHSTIHLNFTNKELAQYYHSLDRIKESGRLEKYLKWIRKQTVETISNNRKGKHSN